MQHPNVSPEPYHDHHTKKQNKKDVLVDPKLSHSSNSKQKLHKRRLLLLLELKVHHFRRGKGKPVNHIHFYSRDSNQKEGTPIGSIEH